MTNYYDQTYFAWQKKAGIYGASQDRALYLPHLKKSDSVLDFGCGGGYLLAKLPVKTKYGVDVNTEALKIARENGLTVFHGIKKIPPHFTGRYHHLASHVGARRRPSRNP